MKTLRNKPKVSTVTLILALIFPTILAALPVANSQVPGTKQTFCIIDFIPNPVGVGQTLLITYGITDFCVKPQMGWEGLWIEITKPDDTTEILPDLKTDTTGLSGTTWTPSVTGTYTLQCHFPEQVRTVADPGRTDPVGTIMLASSSDARELVVQQEAIPYYPGVPLPTEFWTRPIDSQLREWSRISGSWIYGKMESPSKFAPYADQAPESAHILWARPIDYLGGLAGGETGVHGFECGDAYEGKFEDSVIIGGRLYYNRYATGFAGMESQQGVYCVDLHTGEELWFRNNTRVNFGQIFYWSHYNFHGVFAYIWEDQFFRWNAYDPGTGEWLYSFEDIPPGGIFFGLNHLYGPNGELIRYEVNLEEGWMRKWNSTKVISSEGSFGSIAHTQTVFNASTGIMWNKTIPTGLPGAPKVFLEDRIIGSNTAGSLNPRQPNPVFWAIDLRPGHEGELLWNKTWTLPVQDLHVDMPAGHAPNLEDRVFLVTGKETRQYWGFSIDTGDQIWGPTDPLPPINAFSQVYPAGNVWGQGVAGYGYLVVSGMGGVVACFNITTGVELWRYPMTDPYQEILWSNYWPAITVFIADRKVYVSTTEHSVIDPKPRGGPFVCIDLETGDEIFRINGAWRTTRWGGQHIIGDSIIAAFDTYDNQIYAIGKGPSATTVTAPARGVPLGSSVTISGMVTDVSPGTEEYGLRARYPNGVPAISDEDQSEWMLHLYKQFPLPMDAEGVEVTLDAIDPTGAFIHIGRVTSDMSGFYSHTWTPETEGKYTIIATFEGSKSYWASYAETAIGVDPAPPDYPEAPTEGEVAEEVVNQLPEYSTMDLVLIVAVIVAIIIGLANFWALRRK